MIECAPERRCPHRGVFKLPTAVRASMYGWHMSYFFTRLSWLRCTAYLTVVYKSAPVLYLAPCTSFSAYLPAQTCCKHIVLQSANSYEAIYYFLADSSHRVDCSKKCAYDSFELVLVSEEFFVVFGMCSEVFPVPFSWSVKVSTVNRHDTATIGHFITILHEASETVHCIIVLAHVELA